MQITMKVGQKKATAQPAKGSTYTPALPMLSPTAKITIASVITMYSVAKGPIQSTSRPPTRRAVVKAA